VNRRFVWEPALPSALINAASWRLASEIVAALPGTQISQAYTGGIYDELAIAEDNKPLLSINRNGSLHTMTGESSDPFLDGEKLWPEVCRPGGAVAVARRVVRQLGMEGRPRNHSGHRLGYEVIAKVLTTTCLDATGWDAVAADDDDRRAVRGIHELGDSAGRRMDPVRRQPSHRALLGRLAGPYRRRAA
jgi:hypothetical protein